MGNYFRYLNKENFLYRLTQKYVSKHFPGYRVTKDDTKNEPSHIYFLLYICELHKNRELNELKRRTVFP